MKIAVLFALLCCACAVDGQADGALDVSGAAGHGSVVGSAQAATVCKTVTNSTSSVLFAGSSGPTPISTWGWNQQTNGHVNMVRAVVMQFSGNYACVPDHEDTGPLNPQATVVFCKKTTSLGFTGRNYYVKNIAQVGTAPIDATTSWTGQVFSTRHTVPDSTGVLIANVGYSYQGQIHNATMVNGDVWKTVIAAFGLSASSCKQ